MSVDYLPAKRGLCVLYLLKDLVTDSPLCTADIAEASENIKKDIQARLIRIVSPLIGDALKSNDFDPSTEVHKLAVAIFDYDNGLFRKVIDSAFNDMFAFRYLQQVISSLSHFEYSSYIVKCLSVLHSYVAKKEPYEDFITDFLKRSDLDKVDRKVLRTVLHRLKKDTTVPFVTMAIERIYKALATDDFGSATHAHQLAVQIFYYDRELFGTLIYEVILRVYVQENCSSYIEGHLGKIQELSCKVDCFCVLYDFKRRPLKMPIGLGISSNYVSCLCDLLKTPSLNEKDKRKLCHLLEEIIEHDFPPYFPSTPELIRFAINSPNFINYCPNPKDDTDSFRLLYSNLHGTTKALWKYTDELSKLLEDNDSSLDDKEREKWSKFLDDVQKCSGEHSRHLAILFDSRQVVDQPPFSTMYNRLRTLLI